MSLNKNTIVPVNGKTDNSHLVQDHNNDYGKQTRQPPPYQYVMVTERVYPDTFKNAYASYPSPPIYERVMRGDTSY